MCAKPNLPLPVRLMRAVLSALSAVMLGTGALAMAQPTDPALRDNFPIGSSEGALCQVQSVTSPAGTAPIAGMFDRQWTIICRDAAQPVGHIFALRDGGSVDARMDAWRAGRAICTNACTTASGLGWARHRMTGSGSVFVAEGLAAYDDALKLGLASLAEGRIASGPIRVATTSVSDTEALARAQARALDPDRALAEGYRRNHSGYFAEAAEFFGVLDGASDGSERAKGVDPTEYRLNRALQKSNLGEFAEAERLFAEVERLPTGDPVQRRLRRNFRAIHALNQRDYDSALAILAQPLPPLPPLVRNDVGAIALDDVAAAALNGGRGARVIQTMTDREHLTPEERGILIDAQAVHLAGTAERLRGNAGAGKAAQEKALAEALTVRDGRVTSIIRLRAQMLGELALNEEALGNVAAAETRLNEAITLIRVEYPETSALAAAYARHAAFLTRHGQEARAMDIYRSIVASMGGERRSLTGLYNQFAPYFRLLTADGASSTNAAEFFAASQLLVRPGVADTQAILARELSGGSGEAARLFRQSTNLGRDIERARIDLARAVFLPEGPVQQQQVAEIETRLANLSGQQTATLAGLSAFPQYRAIEATSLSLADLTAVLAPDEAYVKLAVVGDAVYALYAAPGGAKAWRTTITAAGLDRAVDTIRASISVQENGKATTYPYDANAARKLYRDLFTPVAAELSAARHVIFEPDGAMLRLPLTILVTADDNLAAYAARLDDESADAFDMRGIAWLGRTTSVSTAVSPLAFRNSRKASASRGSKAYLGMGNNAPAVAGVVRASGGTRAVGGLSGANCDWPLREWGRPIADTELLAARRSIGGGGSDLLTGQAFSDDAVKDRADLADYRILHFATHGLVTAPRPDCPAKPALLTSFGGGDSDGLLSFDEVFDLKLDADLVILSACDTAGAATVAATREAGVSNGGGSALDGLVRAFIGAGGRTVLASHWPVPDDFDATQRLISGLFTASPGDSTAHALLTTQRQLMDDVRTSHPYYWAGFAIIGDGSQPLLAAPLAKSESAEPARSGTR